MRDDVLPDLLKEVEENFTSEYGKSEEIRRAFDVLRAKKATYKNANDFAIEVGEVLSRVLLGSVRADRLPDGKMYYNIAKRLLEPVLRRNYELVADYSRNVQEHLNALAKISLVAQPADLNQDRINGFIERFSKEEDFNNVSWLLGEPIVNFTQSVVDDSISKNVDLHAKSGLRPKIIRKTDKKPCRWCVSLAGVYDYPRVPKDVYRRHQNCRCMVDYDPKNGKVQNVWTKKERVKRGEALNQNLQRVANIYDNNRKSDSREYQKIVAVLGRENAPISLSKFQELKYNDGEGYEGLKDRVYIKEKLNSGEWLDKINPEKQARHIQSTAGNNKSYFYDGVDVNSLYKKYKMTGKILTTRNGRTHKELIDLPKKLDYGIDIFSGQKINGFTIHYSKSGSHIIPTYHKEN